MPPNSFALVRARGVGGVGQIWLDTTSGAADDTKLLAEALLERHGVLYLDCAVSGGPAGAHKGQLAALVGGDAAAFERARGVLACFSPERKTTHLG